MHFDLFTLTFYKIPFIFRLFLTLILNTIFVLKDAMEKCVKNISVKMRSKSVLKIVKKKDNLQKNVLIIVLGNAEKSLLKKMQKTMLKNYCVKK